MGGKKKLKRKVKKKEKRKPKSLSKSMFFLVENFTLCTCPNQNVKITGFILECGIAGLQSAMIP